MGRAYEVRKASIQKTGAIKAKTYSSFAKEIYLAAKKGTPEIESNMPLKRLVEKAKKSQVPNDIINRAIEKAKGIGGEDYHEVIYEGFGPGASTLIIKTLTDNVNRTVGMVRAAFNKVNKSLGVTNSVAFGYDYLALISFKTDKQEEIFDSLLNSGIEPEEFEYEDGELLISVHPNDINNTKDVVEKTIGEVEYNIDETGMYAKNTTDLNAEDLEAFNKLYRLLDDIEDVTEIYHNVNNRD